MKQEALEEQPLVQLIATLKKNIHSHPQRMVSLKKRRQKRGSGTTETCD